MAAVSQFLTATSGGFGSGQRINDTELNAVLDSRSLWDDWYIRMQRLRADGKPVDKLSPTQRQQMKDMLMIALKDADTAIDQNIATVADAGDAALASHWRKTQDRMRQKAGLSKPGAAPAAATPQMPAVRNVTITPAKPKG
jgi:hypothetical protein